MPIHEQILQAALRLCTARRDWTFTPAEIVAALPHANTNSVRTHIVSRCCVNAPNHPIHRWPYFRRVRRGVYEVLPAYRHNLPTGRPEEAPASIGKAAEAAAAYAIIPAHRQKSIHAVVTESEGWYVSQCLEIAVITQGRSLDETLANLKEATQLYLQDEDQTLLGITDTVRLVVTYETTHLIPPGVGHPPRVRL